jgi:hypothetical protein
MFEDEADFKKIVGRLKIDSEPNPEHREKLRREMIAAFNKAGEQRLNQTSNFEAVRRTIMNGAIPKIAVAAVVIIAAAVGIYYFRPGAPQTKPGAAISPAPAVSGGQAAVPEGMTPIEIKLPRALFVGTPLDIRVANLEKPLGRARPPFLAPVGTKNVALGKLVTSSDKVPIIGEIELITDGDKEATDGSYVELGPFLQHVTIDLEATCEIYAIVVWHYHKQARVYYDVVVQTVDDPNFTTNVKTLFNNDIDNSTKLGAGQHKHYTETNEGKLIDAKGVRARYVRLYSNGNSSDDLNHYIEVEVYGRPAK